jgi:ketosteroid isomerase-like protein
VTQANHQIVRDFMAALSTGQLPEELMTEDMSVWTSMSGDSDKASFLGGVQILASLFAGDFRYMIDALTAEEDRAIAEVQSNGTFLDGEPFHNMHVFVFRVRDGRISHFGEFMNQFTVQEKIMPRMQEIIARMTG